MSKSPDRVEVFLIVIGVLIAIIVLGVAFQGHLISEGEKAPEESPSRVEHGAVDAPYLASVLARLQEQRRRNGLGYTSDPKQLASGATAPMRTPGAEVRATPTSFTITARSRDEPGVWYRLRVDRRARRVTATCGGDPTESCVDGRWAIERFATSERQLLGP